MPKPVVVVVDGNNFVSRAFHAGEELTSSEGVNTTAITVSFKMLLRLMQDHDPDLLIFTWDRGRPKWRKELLKAYKSDRDKKITDEERALRNESMRMTQDYFSHCGFVNISDRELEADDIMYAIAKDDIFKHCDIRLITADKDLYQALAENVVMIPIDKRPYTLEDFREEFNMEPETFHKWKAIAGDKSDSIPGIKGIGKKWLEACFSNGNTNPIRYAKSRIDAKSRALMAGLEEYKTYKKVCNLAAIPTHCKALASQHIVEGLAHLKKFGKNRKKTLLELATKYEMVSSYLVQKKTIDDKLQKANKRYREFASQLLSECE